MRERYRFDEFVWDASVPALYYDDELVEDAGRRALQVLGVFLRRPNQLISHQQVLDDVWGEDNVTVTPDNVHQCISQLRKLFRSRSNADYFKSKKGIGYTFVADVVVEPTTTASRTPARQTLRDPLISNYPNHIRRWMMLVGVVLLVGTASGAYWILSPSRDEAEIKQLINESQRFESLTLYQRPADFTETDLDRYWINDPDPTSNSDHRRIWTTTQRLLAEGRRYGPETKCDRLDIEWVKMNTSGDLATVHTFEQWSIAVYAVDGQLIKNRMVGPYFVDYVVRKAGGRWLIDRSNTGRVVRPTPRLTSIEPEDPPKAGTPFAVRVTGEDFQSEAVYLEILGPGCPESNPCAVTNSNLRTGASLSERILDKVLLTLPSGTFRIVARNADSSPSEPITLAVP